MNLNNRVWICPKPGVENLILEDLPVPQLPTPTSVLIKVLAAGLNPVDYKKLSWPSTKFPSQTGLDGSGLIEEMGSQVDQTIYKKGALVVFHTSLFNKEGSFASYTIIESKYLCLVPMELFEQKEVEKLAVELAAMPCAAMTAYQAVFVKLGLVNNNAYYNVRKINSIVVTAAVGGVGSFCLQYLKNWKEETGTSSIKIIAICSKSNFEQAVSLGATHCIDYKNDDISSKVKEFTENQGVDGWIDLVGKESANIGLNCLAFEGNLVIVVENPDFKTDLIFSRALSINNVALGFVYATNDEEKKLEIPKMLGKIVEMYAKNKIKVEVRTLKLTEGKNALLELKDRHVRRKLVMKME